MLFCVGMIGLLAGYAQTGRCRREYNNAFLNIAGNLTPCCPLWTTEMLPQSVAYNAIISIT